MNRRSFLSTGIGAAALAGSAQAGRVSKMKFGLTSYQWGEDWDIPTMIANCAKAKASGVELRTSAHYAHGVEPEIGAGRRREVARVFADSPVKLIGINSAERFDWPDPAALARAIERAKEHVKLAHDTGATGVRVFPNAFHREVPEEKTLAQIARALDEVGGFAKDFGQMIRIENHGPVGTLANLRKILDQVEARNVRVKLNGDERDNEGGRFRENFALVKDRLGDTLHMRWYGGTKFPYQLQWELLTAAGWEGWCFVEESAKVPDRVAALITERQEWEEMVSKAL